MAWANGSPGGVGFAAGALVVALAAFVLPASAQQGPGAPPVAVSADRERIFIDTTVDAVTVDETMTVALMDETSESPCASRAYVFARERSKWLYQTGRLMQAMKEQAPLRISFNCRDGVQSINAIQFLAPPADALPTDLTARSEANLVAPGAGRTVRLPAVTVDRTTVPLPPTTGAPAANSATGSAVGRTLPPPPIPLPAAPTPLPGAGNTGERLAPAAPTINGAAR